MPTWNPAKNPDRYPARWHGLAVAQPGEYLLETPGDPADAKRVRNKWNSFKACLRNHPLHPAGQAAEKRRFRIRQEQTASGIVLWLKIEWAGELVEQILTQLHQD